MPPWILHEFINRIDDTVVFHSLGKEQIASIAGLQIQALKQRLQLQNITLDLNPEALDYLAKAGYDPVYGARPLKRVIQQKLENPLAQALLTGKFRSGDTIHVQYEQDQLQFS